MHPKPLELKPFRVEERRVTPGEGTVDGPDGAQRLEPKVMAVLAYLVANRERIVSKDELLEAVWPDSVVEEVALARSISEIRRVFCDDAKKPRLVETFPKRGYKWIGPVETAESVVPTSRRWPAAALGATALLVLTLVWWVFRPARAPSVPAQPSIAVLPFVNMSADPTNGYFADGITEELITQLSKIDELRVISRTSVMPYKETGHSVREIAGELGVTTILEGSVRLHEGRVRITGQLVDAREDTHLWAETYDRELEDVFEVQRDVAEKIAQALSTELTLEERARLEFVPTDQVSAYDTYLRALAFYRRIDPTNNANAIELFEQAITIDPNFALAHAGLADALARKRSHTAEREWARKGVATAQKAIELDPHLPESHKALGHAFAELGQYQHAARAYEMALELRPNYSDALNNLAIVYSVTGEWDRSFRTYVRMLPLDPARPLKHANFGSLLRQLGEDATATEWLEYALEQEPHYYPAHHALATLALVHGRTDAVGERLERELDVLTACRGCLQLLGLVAQLDGDHAAARNFLERALDLSGDPTVPRLRIGQLEWSAGRRSEAERWLELASEGPRDAIASGSEWWGPEVEHGRHRLHSRRPRRGEHLVREKPSTSADGTTGGISWTPCSRTRAKMMRSRRSSAT